MLFLTIQGSKRCQLPVLRDVEARTALPFFLLDQGRHTVNGLCERSNRRRTVPGGGVWGGWTTAAVAVIGICLRL